MDNFTLQNDELEAIKSIYDEDWTSENASGTSFSIKINDDAILFLYLNENYPKECPPNYLLQAPFLTKSQKDDVALALNGIYIENIGQPVLYQWIEKVREIVSNVTENNKSLETIVEDVSDKEPELKRSDYNVHHGSTIADRKSFFQAHVCRIHSLQEVNDIVEYLKENKKIFEATHNILAYRIDENNSILQDYDDDGEKHAGGRLLHLLTVLKLTNVMVVVSRWYGGIQLGPDRFRHINNAAREALQSGGFIS